MNAHKLSVVNLALLKYSLGSKSGSSFLIRAVSVLISVCSDFSPSEANPLKLVKTSLGLTRVPFLELTMIRLVEPDGYAPEPSINKSTCKMLDLLYLTS